MQQPQVLPAASALNCLMHHDEFPLRKTQPTIPLGVAGAGHKGVNLVANRVSLAGRKVEEARVQSYVTRLSLSFSSLSFLSFFIFTFIVAWMQQPYRYSRVGLVISKALAGLAGRRTASWQQTSSESRDQPALMPQPGRRGALVSTSRTFSRLSRHSSCAMISY